MYKNVHLLGPLLSKYDIAGPAHGAVILVGFDLSRTTAFPTYRPIFHVECASYLRGSDSDYGGRLGSGLFRVCPK